MVNTLYAPANKGNLQKARSMQLTTVFQNTVSRVPTDPIEIGGYRIDNIRDALLQNQEDIRQLSLQYATVGDYIDAAGFDANEKFTPEQIQSFFDNYYKPAGKNGSGSSAHLALTDEAVEGKATSNYNSSKCGTASANSALTGVAAIISCLNPADCLTGSALFGGSVANAINSCDKSVTEPEAVTGFVNTLDPNQCMTKDSQGNLQQTACGEPAFADPNKEYKGDTAPAGYKDSSGVFQQN